MADKYERWNKWAPRYIADLMKDFGLTISRLRRFPGNFAAESGYFNSLQEKDPTGCRVQGRLRPCAVDRTAQADI
jgi:hypothetical protein